MELPGPILVTGGTGFFGAHLVAALRSHRYSVISSGSREDLTDSLTARRIIQGNRIRTVFHLAARVGGIGANRTYPWTFFDSNLRMGLNVLSASIDGIVQVLVVSGTVCAYPHSPPIPFQEGSLWDGFPEPTNAPYGVAKRVLQTGLLAANKEKGLKFAFPIPTNLFGPGDHFDLQNSHVIPVLIRKFEEAKDNGHDEVVLWGTGKPTRDFLYAGDAAEAFIGLAEYVLETGTSLEAVNLGSGEETSISELARLIKAATGYTGRVRWDTSMPDGQPRRVVDSSLARGLIGWRPKVSLEDGVYRTVQWYRRQKVG